jgi:hypothetical protein
MNLRKAPLNTQGIGTEGKSVFQIEKELLRRFGYNRQYMGTVEDGMHLIKYLDQVTTAPYNAPHSRYGSRELLSLYTRHLYCVPRDTKPQLLTNYEHEDRRPRWIARARAMINDAIHSTSGLFTLTQSAVVVITMMHGSTGNIHRSVRTSVVTSSGTWFTSSLCSYVYQVGTPLEIAYRGFRIIGQDATLPCPIL